MLPVTYSFFGKHRASGLSVKRGILYRIQPHHKTVGKAWELILGNNFAFFVCSGYSKIWPFLSKIQFLKSRPFYDFFWYFPYHDLRLKIWRMQCLELLYNTFVNCAIISIPNRTYSMRNAQSADKLEILKGFSLICCIIKGVKFQN